MLNTAILRLSQPGRRLFRRLPTRYFAPAMSILALALLCFIAGAFVAEFKFPFYREMLQPSFRGLRALRENRALNESQERLGRYPARDELVGTTRHNPEEAYHGYTLYATMGESTTARLVDMDGTVVHRWHLPFREVWPDPKHLDDPLPEDRIGWHCIRLLPNGNLLANYVANFGRPYGYGLVMMDKDSKVVWKYSDTAHHDFDIDAEGNIYTLLHNFHEQRVVGASHLRRPMLADDIVKLSPEGVETMRIVLFDAFRKSKFRSYLQSIESDKRGDHTHANAIAVISESFASHNPFCQPGDVMISIRNPSMLAIVNLERQEVVWAARGIWSRQHDCDPLANGNVLLFDNKGKLSSGGVSRILEWNPRDGSIPWYYAGRRDEVFESDVRGCQQRLPNGNVLITESNNGRLFEVNRKREIVWEYRNTDRFGDDNEYVAVVYGGTRYSPDQLSFLQKSEVALTETRSTVR